MGFIKEYWFLISGVVIPVISFFVGKYRTRLKDQAKDNTLLKDGLCALQRNSLLKSCEDYLDRFYCSIEAKLTLNELYKSYHALGGDQFITQMVERVNELPNRRED